MPPPAGRGHISERPHLFVPTGRPRGPAHNCHHVCQALVADRKKQLPPPGRRGRMQVVRRSRRRLAAWRVAPRPARTLHPWHLNEDFERATTQTRGLWPRYPHGPFDSDLARRVSAHAHGHQARGCDRPTARVAGGALRRPRRRTGRHAAALSRLVSHEPRAAAPGLRATPVGLHQANLHSHPSAIVSTVFRRRTLRHRSALSSPKVRFPCNIRAPKVTRPTQIRRNRTPSHAPGCPLTNHERGTQRLVDQSEKFPRHRAAVLSRTLPPHPP